jgi:hypothetical protein
MKKKIVTVIALILSLASGFLLYLWLSVPRAMCYYAGDGYVGDGYARVQELRDLCYAQNPEWKVFLWSVLVFIVIFAAVYHAPKAWSFIFTENKK